MSQQFKEFFITDNGGPQFEKYISWQPQTANDLHVIEYSAYESQRAVIEKLQKDIDNLSGVAKCPACGDDMDIYHCPPDLAPREILERHNKELRADKAKLVECVKFYAEGRHWDYVLGMGQICHAHGETARKTLQELGIE